MQEAVSLATPKSPLYAGALCGWKTEQVPGRREGKAVGAEIGSRSRQFYPLQVTHWSSCLGYCPLGVWDALEGPYWPGLSITETNCSEQALKRCGHKAGEVLLA